MTSLTTAASRLLQHGAAAQRWVVRYALTEDDAAAHQGHSLTDALGSITELTSEFVSISTRSGLVTVPLSAVRLAKPVPPPPPRRIRADK
ncbi:acetyltransferase [Neomicrococcus lactis]|uniref:acetyltransferase n=1 Tax=Neomicrococcus lactis TaxID=732241 RepID=UPI002300BCC7|nr:acetyltransferase [Neomicrococcus lactis]